MTSKKLGIALFSLLVLALFAFTPATAADAYAKNITAGDTVLVGESGLNIAAAVAGSPYIAYWAPGSSGTDAPAASINVTSSLAGNFYVDPSNFGSYLGTWYNWNGIVGAAPGASVFTVEQPSLSVTAWTVAGTAIDGKKVIADSNVTLRLDTNFYKIFSGARILDVDNTTGINLYVTDPNGATLVALKNGTGWTNSISNLQPNVQTYYANNVSGTDSSVSTWWLKTADYPAGTYKIWAESNINGMKDNLGSVTGKTVSNTATFTLDKETVSVTADKETVVRGNGFAVTIEGAPKSDYYIWVSGTNGTSNIPPTVTLNQDDVVAPGSVLAQNYVFKATTSTILGDSYSTASIATATTSSSGTITVGFTTTSTTKDATFTIRAQKANDATKQLYDTVKVKVEKGAVTITASGDGSYYLGEEVILSGTNTDSDDTYLFITGPNLPANGGILSNPQMKINTSVATGYLKESVKTDDTWEYKWDTSGVTLDAGTYTIYAVSINTDKSGLSNAKYDTVSIVVKKPFVTATTSASTVAKGDKVFIRGTAEGNPTAGVAIWILGKNYWNGANKDVVADSAKVTTTVNDDGSFELELGTADTKDLASGQYFVVVQHPMYNGQFDVDTKANSNPVMVEGKAKNGAINNNFVIWGDGKLQGSDAATALIGAINSADIDDTYTKLTFLVEEPWIRINSIGDHYIGDQFTITGTTNLAIDDDLLVEVTSSSFEPTAKTQSGEFSGVSSTVKVTEGDSYNEWAMDVDASTFKADEYIVNVEAIEASVTATTTFNVLKTKPTVGPTEQPTTGPTSQPTTQPTQATPQATASPGFGAFVALIGLGAVAALVMRKD